MMVVKSAAVVVVVISSLVPIAEESRISPGLFSLPLKWRDSLTSVIFSICDNSSCSDFSVCYGGYKKAVELLATADCLLSLAEVAKMPGYVW